MPISRKNNRRVPAVIIGEDSTNMLAVMRSLGRRNVPVHALTTSPSRILRRSRFCRSVTPLACNDDFASQQFIDLAKRLQTAPVLICCNDVAIERAGRNASAVNEHYRPITSPVRAFELLSKIDQHELAQQAGLTSPSTAFLSTFAELDACADELSYPVIAKPTVWYRRGGFDPKVMILHDSAEARRLLHEPLSVPGTQLVLQKYISGDDRCVEVFLALTTPEGELIAGCPGRKLRQHPCGAGVTSLSEIIHAPDMEANSAALLRTARIGGMIGVEFKRDPATGQLMFIEMSLRPESFISLAIAAGIDMPYMAYRIAVNQPLLEPVRRRNVLWIDWERDARVVWRGWRDRQITLREYIASLNGNRTSSIFSWDDPLPFACSLLNFVQHRVGRIVSRKT